MGFFEALSRGLERSREALNEVFYFGGEVDEDFWENLEDTLVMGDMGAEISMQVTDDLRDEAARRNLKTARQLRGALADRLSQVFVQPDGDIFRDTPSCVLFVGINGAGKTTTVGKMEETIRLLRERAPECRIMAGGAVLTEEYARRIGADFYGKDAMSDVRYAGGVTGRE